MSKGIILAGGTGSRLFPITYVVSKQLIPVYDKPMIYYPLATLMLAGIRDILIITTTNDESNFNKLLGDGSQWGLNIQYATQDKPDGIAQAFIIGEEFIGEDNVCLILGDNLFCGNTDFAEATWKATQKKQGATIFGYYVNNPQEYGVVEFDVDRKVISLEEKPTSPKSNYAIPGIYFYDNKVVDIVKGLKPSNRGELEITDLKSAYLDREELHVHMMGRGNTWLDTGTPESLADATQFVQVIQKRQGLKIACLEEIAYTVGYINREVYDKSIAAYGDTPYGQYLKRI